MALRFDSRKWEANSPFDNWVQVKVSSNPKWVYLKFGEGDSIHFRSSGELDDFILALQVAAKTAYKEE